MKKKWKDGLGPEKVDKTPESNITYFNQNINDLGLFCDKINDQDDTRIQELMKNYTVIRLKSLFEYHLKEFLIEIIDDKALNVKGEDVLREDAITIQLDLLDKMQKDSDEGGSNYSKGRIICAHLDTLPPGKVFKILSRLNEVNFGKWFTEILLKMAGKSHTDDDVFEYLNEMHRERNDITHNLKDTELPIAELKDLIHGIAVLLERILVFSKFNLHQKQNHVDYVNTHIENLGRISAKQFQEITKKHHQSRSN